MDSHHLCTRSYRDCSMEDVEVWKRSCNTSRNSVTVLSPYRPMDRTRPCEGRDEGSSPSKDTRFKGENMKALGLRGYFKLPDDFNSGLADALRLLADYHESKEAKDKKQVSDVDPENYWAEFLKDIKTGNRVTMSISISELKDGSMVPTEGMNNERA